MKKISLLAMSLLILGSCTNRAVVPAPSEEYYVEVVKELSSPDYYGRSNYNNGTIKAAKFILEELQALNVGPIPQEAIDRAWA